MTQTVNEIASRWHHSHAIVPRLAAATRVALGARHSYICMSRQFISAAFKSCPHPVRTLLFLRIGHLIFVPSYPRRTSTAVKRIKKTFFLLFFYLGWVGLKKPITCLRKTGCLILKIQNLLKPLGTITQSHLESVSK